MRTTTFESKEIYHLKGNGSRDILFIEEEDYARFLFLLLFFQSPTPLHNISWYAKAFLKKRVYSLGTDLRKLILKDRYLSLLCFSITPNSFDLLVHNHEEMTPSVYMQRVLTSYSKYFNSKYKKRGHVFSGPFESRHIKNKTDLLDTSASIHSQKSTNSSTQNFWSSYPDYIDTNRWGEFLNTDLILSQFKSQSTYRDFVSSFSNKT